MKCNVCHLTYTYACQPIISALWYGYLEAAVITPSLISERLWITNTINSEQHETIMTSMTHNCLINIVCLWNNNCNNNNYLSVYCTAIILCFTYLPIRFQSKYLSLQFLVGFFFEKTTYCCRTRRLSVRPSVRLSVRLCQ